MFLDPVKFVRAFTLFVATAVAAVAACAQQSYPSRPVKLLIGYGPGGGTDNIARLYASKLQDILNTPVSATPGQIALAWMLAKKSWIVPLFGTRRIERLEENLGAASVQLTPDEFDEVDGLSANFKVQGERYPEHMLRRSGL